MWLKKLLAPQASWAPWMAFAHSLLNRHASKAPVVKPSARCNYFAQTWKIAVTKLPLSLRRMVKIAQQFRLTIKAPSLSVGTLNDMPIWLHPFISAEAGNLNNFSYSNCITSEQLYK